MRLSKETLDNYLEYTKKYQRPLRSILWVILISIAFIKCLDGSYKECIDNNISEIILYGMFIDLGIYGYNRTREKIQGMKIIKKPKIEEIN